MFIICNHIDSDKIAGEYSIVNHEITVQNNYPQPCNRRNLVDKIPDHIQWLNDNNIKYCHSFRFKPDVREYFYILEFEKEDDALLFRLTWC